MDAFTWFSISSKAIDSVLGLFFITNDQINKKVSQLKQNATFNNIKALIILIVIMVSLIITFYIFFKRIILPLNLLEISAKKIADGDLQYTTSLRSNDEFGKLGRAFELMRKNLLKDFTEREQTTIELLKLTTAIEQSMSSVIITDTEGLIEYVNPEFTNITGYTLGEVIGEKTSLLKSGKTSLDTYRQLWACIKAGNVWQSEMLNKKKNGVLYWESVSISPVKDSTGKIINFISIKHDINEQKQMEELLKFQAYHDNLTSLPNRTLLTDRFNQVVSRAQRQELIVALLTIDLDNFKLINDSLGHAVGDQVLITVAQRLQQHRRGNDTVARFGGDEFILMLPDIKSPQLITGLTQKIFNTVNQPILINNQELQVTCSIGISLWHEDGSDLETLLMNADAAMYRAKEKGQNQFQFYTNDLNIQAKKRLTMENFLRQSLSRNELVLHYQPQVSLENGCISGFEALVRWQHPDMGIIPPAEFIPLAEETGLIVPIGEWVLRSACMQIKQWLKSGLQPGTMAVNVSGVQIQHTDLVNVVTQILEETKLAPHLLELELTESAIMKSPERAIEQLEKLKDHGVKLAIDDFGTGYSSLSYLQRFPFNKLKIDRSFIKDITFNADNATLTCSIIAMAQGMRLHVLAEGIETEEQLSYLRQNGCETLQGFYFSQPLEKEKAEKLLKESVQLKFNQNE